MPLAFLVKSSKEISIPPFSFIIYHIFCVNLKDSVLNWASLVGFCLWGHTESDTTDII